MGKSARTLTLIATAVGALVVAGAVAASIGPPRIPATAYTLRAHLDPSQMVPAPTATVPAGASARFEGLLARAPVYTQPPNGRSIKIVWKLAWRLTTSNLTGPVTRVQVNQGAKGHAGQKLLTLCSPCTTSLRGSMQVTAADAKVLLSSGAYVTARTSANSGGEVRGQIARVRLDQTPSVKP